VSEQVLQATRHLVDELMRAPGKADVTS
jgi:hypothetical protein